ncbi:MAG: hypothetical protein K8F25_14575, partial [Fimbriimonadaceae bacterium]|nr:hypothetical protein [Alphaproteobacteria bacterium]
EISIGDTVKTIAGVMNADVTVITDDQRLRPERSEVERLWADNTKANNLLSWSPTFGGSDGFRRGIEKTADWFSNPENLKFYPQTTYTI